MVEAAAWVCVRERRVLVVRATGSDAFYLPGGKPEPGESDAGAAAREVSEEVGINVDPAGLRHFTTIDAPAHNRPPGTRVRLVCFTSDEPGEPEAANEIAEIGWFTSADAGRCAPAIRMVLDELVGADLID
ncbi:DNA mismatch repair protein MutT [Actinoplanes lobatus]|uniref:8-oxo-dGTP pyrophosphatase MutT (NUDIX family) n=1 Tax=Actinoplanes lobatus TaxID=113568 RepID=A0A7W7MGQ5_9ACTN|nr:NUDIX domain-containing protein [Actinoplanes lobatus]MBB4749629.1 8-oxo-dGTP pyrophosphatase MutT (NUDIX family) [Actinoplanes lobatus]GGN78447.1 DNA mismatch repair protein MutT [Actinoplanes lobatus]GIE38368.1 DNA mismatch repair protein MutT [Actinoplanes lobatus]